jgi:hypothetical protein
MEVGLMEMSGVEGFWPPPLAIRIFACFPPVRTLNLAQSSDVISAITYIAKLSASSFFPRDRVLSGISVAAQNIYTANKITEIQKHKECSGI